MGFQGFPERIGRRLFTQWSVIATMVLAGACGRGASEDGDQPSRPADATKIDDVSVDVSASGLIVHYRTRTSTRDCNAQTVEMPRVWELVVKPRLANSAVPRVILFPEDASGQSLGVAFTENASGKWAASAPCSISIPAGGSDEPNTGK
jgi:hypothetical protein